MNNLYLGIKGHVVCLEKKTGKELWKTKLKGMSLTNVIYDNKNIYAYANGHLFCLDADFGKVLWKNTLSGYGYGSCIFATDVSTQQQAYIIDKDQAQQNAQASQAAT